MFFTNEDIEDFFLQNKLHLQSVHSGSEMLRKFSLAQNDSRYFAQSLFLLDLHDIIQYYLIIDHLNTICWDNMMYKVVYDIEVRTKYMH